MRCKGDLATMICKGARMDYRGYSKRTKEEKDGIILPLAHQDSTLASCVLWKYARRGSRLRKRLQ